MKTSILQLCSAILLLSSCQKELSSDSQILKPPPILVPPTSSLCTSGDYVPLTVGNTWNYVTLGNLGSVTIINGDTTIKGLTFKKARQSGFAQPDLIKFVRYANGEYSDYVPLVTGGMIVKYANDNPLRSNLATGSKWADTIVNAGITEIHSYEIKAKGLSHDVDTLKFKNVIHVYGKVILDMPPFYNMEIISSTDYYFAQCIGLIFSRTNGYVGGIPTQAFDQKIISYSVR